MTDTPKTGKDLARKPRGFPDRREALLRAEAESNMPVEPPLEPDNIYRQLKLFYV